MISMEELKITRKDHMQRYATVDEWVDNVAPRFRLEALFGFHLS